MRKNRDSVNENDFFSIILFLLFETVAVSLWFIKGDLFYLLNFSYIGCCLALGTTAKIFGPLFSDADGAATPAGQLWYWIFAVQAAAEAMKGKTGDFALCDVRFGVVVGERLVYAGRTSVP